MRFSSPSRRVRRGPFEVRLERAVEHGVDLIEGLLQALPRRRDGPRREAALEALEPAPQVRDVPIFVPEDAGDDSLRTGVAGERIAVRAELGGPVLLGDTG